MTSERNLDLTEQTSASEPSIYIYVQHIEKEES